MGAGVSGACICSSGGGGGSGQVLYDAIVDAAGGGDFVLISAAIAAGHVSIWVRNGTYNESVFIDLPINCTLHGESLGGVIVNFSGVKGFRIKGDNPFGVKTDGTISISNGSSIVTGLATTFNTGTNALAINDKIMIGNTYHKIIGVSSGTQLVLEEIYQGASISGASYIAGTTIDGVTVENLTIIGSVSLGIAINEANNCIIKNVLFDDSTSGFVIANTASIQITNVILQHVKSAPFTCSGTRGMSISDSRVINGNGNGLQLSSCMGVTVDTCFFEGNAQNGLNMSSCSNCKVSDSSICLNELAGITSNTTCTEIIFDACHVLDNGTRGIDVGAFDQEVSNCIVKRNGAEGVAIGNPTKLVGGLVADNVGVGISVLKDFVGISDCEIRDNLQGVLVSATSDNTKISNCNIRDNLQEGIEILNGATRTNCNNNDIHGNGTSGTFDGLLTNGDRNIIGMNYIFDNTGDGLNIDTNAATSMVNNNDLFDNTGTNFTQSGTAITDDNNTI